MGLVETGKRNLALDRVPRLADILGLDAIDLCKSALADQHPLAYAALFGPTPAIVSIDRSGPSNQEIRAGLSLLPKNLRDAFGALLREIVLAQQRERTAIRRGNAQRGERGPEEESPDPDAILDAPF